MLKHAVSGVAATTQLLSPSQMLALLQFKLGLVSLGVFAVLLLLGWMIWQDRNAVRARLQIKCPYFEFTRETENGVDKRKPPTRSRKHKDS